VNIIIEDPKMANILYLGTDHGLYVSLDTGKNWNLFQGQIPNVAIYDMVIQERENHLVIGTHGRSVYVVDLKPIHQWATPGPLVMEKK
jgi:ligand-binding sensor domain-containing protein